MWNRWLHGAWDVAELVPPCSPSTEMHCLEYRRKVETEKWPNQGLVRRRQGDFICLLVFYHLNWPVFCVGSEEKLNLAFRQIHPRQSILAFGHWKEVSVVFIGCRAENLVETCSALTKSQRFLCPALALILESLGNTQLLRKCLSKHIRNITELHGCLRDHRIQTNSKINDLIYGSPSAHKYPERIFTETDAGVSECTILEVKSGYFPSTPIYLFRNVLLVQLR